MTGASACVRVAPEPACASVRPGFELAVQLVHAGAEPRRSLAFAPPAAVGDVRITTEEDDQRSVVELELDHAFAAREGWCVPFQVEDVSFSIGDPAPTSGGLLLGPRGLLAVRTDNESKTKDDYVFMAVVQDVLAALPFALPIERVGVGAEWLADDAYLQATKRVTRRARYRLRDLGANGALVDVHIELDSALQPYQGPSADPHDALFGFSERATGAFRLVPGAPVPLGSMRWTRRVVRAETLDAAQEERTVEGTTSIELSR